MPFSTQTALDLYRLPDEGEQTHTDLVALIDSATATLRLIMYGFTSASLADALIRAQQRGVEVRIILDHTQSTGPAEVSLLHRLMLSIPPACFRIGTSSQRQIIHSKLLIVDGLAEVPDAQYPGWQAARAAGYPVTAEGSLNWSDRAFRQMNTLCLMPGKGLARWLHTVFDDQWAWLDQHEPAYQPATSEPAA